jgi:ABC-2 type transport system permease protein
VAGLAGAAAFGRPLLRMAYRAEYEAHSGLLVLVMASAIFVYAAVVLGYVVTSARAFVMQLPLLMTVAAVSAGANWLLVPAVGLRGAVLAVGAFISTTTKNQIIAGGATFAACLLLWILDWVSAYETAAWAKVVSYLSVVTHFEPFSKGVLDSRDAVFYVSVIFLGLFLTARSMESLRWRA